MHQTKRKWDRISSKNRQMAIEKIIGWYKKESSEEIGYLAAEAILDMVLELVSDHVYYKAIEDVLKIIALKNADLQVEIEMLKE